MRRPITTKQTKPVPALTNVTYPKLNLHRQTSANPTKQHIPLVHYGKNSQTRLPKLRKTATSRNKAATAEERALKRARCACSQWPHKKKFDLKGNQRTSPFRIYFIIRYLSGSLHQSVPAVVVSTNKIRNNERTAARGRPVAVAYNSDSPSAASLAGTSRARDFRLLVCGKGRSRVCPKRGHGGARRWGLIALIWRGRPRRRRSGTR